MLFIKKSDQLSFGPKDSVVVGEMGWRVQKQGTRGSVGLSTKKGGEKDHGVAGCVAIRPSGATKGRVGRKEEGNDETDAGWVVWMELRDI